MSRDSSDNTGPTPVQDIGLLNDRIGLLEQQVAAYKQREKQLIQKTKLYRTYFSENVAGAYISTPDGRLLLCNREFLRFFGFTSIKQAMESSVEDLYVSREDRNAFLNHLQTRKRVKGYQHILKRLDGTMIHLIGNAFAVFNSKGKLEYIQGFLLDITHEKQLEKQLQHAQKMEAVGTLAGGIAHDFNNILSGIFGNAQLARSRIHSPEKAGKHIDNIVTGAQRAAELVQQILTNNKETGPKKYSIRPGTIVREVVTFIRSTLPASINITVRLSPTGKIRADPVQIHRLLMNLCINASHAMGNRMPGVLGISLDEITIDKTTNPGYPPGNYIKLKISDTGHGIDKKNMGKIFDPYFTTNLNSGGSGIGLASVKSIIEEHKGYIKVNSILGRGSEFTVYFPVIPPEKSGVAYR